MATSRSSVFTCLVSEHNYQHSATNGEDDVSMPGESDQHLATEAGISLVKSDQQKLKKCVRKSDWAITHPIRRCLWKDLCLRNKQMGPSVYDDLANSGAEAEEEFVETLSLPQFVDESHVLYYKLNMQGQQTLHKMMLVIENAHPEITYCPLLLPIASALLHYVEEDVCFDCLEALLQEQTFKYLHQTRVEYEAFLMNFIKICAKFIPQTYSYLKEQKGSAEFFKDWIWIIFEELPFTHLVRIIDCFVVEGLKVLYRVGLAIADSYKKSKGTKRDDNLLSFIKEYAKNIPESPNKLLKIAFQFRGFSRATIRSFQTKNQGKVRNTMADKHHHQNLSRNITTVTELHSAIINQTQLQVLWRWLPNRIALLTPKLVFSTSEHGYSLMSLFNQCEDKEPLLLLVKTIKREVFGAYLSTNLEERNNKERKLAFFGTGECFLFSLVPEQEKYGWVGLDHDEALDASNQMFIRAAGNLLVIGGGDGDGLHLKNDLDNGWTSYCDTFSNPPLASGGQFQCAHVEVVSFITDE
ncbi:GTPase-activating protein skywalker-like [Anneissia japonica]|uniref:GTPase-activating protein skywalker-like n=1 Tax=Anneissia japonica TaxID=1529436 RepID=UPI001425988D|nr:GTPase-activating protein skywalker-like [Anneissia japonica]